MNWLRNWLIGLLCLAIGVLPAGAAFAHAFPNENAAQTQHQNAVASASKSNAAKTTTQHADCHKAANAAGTSTHHAITPAKQDTGTGHNKCCPDGKACSGLCLIKCAQVLGVVAPSLRHLPVIAERFVDLASATSEGRAIRPAPPPPRT